MVPPPAKNKLIAMFQGTHPQILATLTASISAISDGMQYGWTAPVIPILQKPNSKIQLTEQGAQYLENLYVVGGIAGLPLTIFLVDKIGRHKSILMSNIISVLAWILIGFASRIEMLYVARFLAGFAGDMAFIAVPMYIAEIAHQKIRGFLASIIYIMMLIGILIIYSVTPYVEFYVPALVGCIFQLLQLIVFPLMPESPYYLLSRNRNSAALLALNRLRTTKDNRVELEEMSTAIERQRNEPNRLRDLILIDSNRRAIIIIIVLNAAQQFSGITVILMNLHTILNAAQSIYIDPSEAAITFSVFMLVSGIGSSLFVDRFGRKILLIASSLLSSICLLIIGTYFALNTYGIDLEMVSWIPISAVMIYAATFKFGLGIVPIVLTSEIFSTNVKAIGMTIADAVYVVFSLASIALYQFLREQCGGLHVPFLFFGVCTFLVTVYCMFCVPETKGKTLEDIQLKLKKRNKALT